MADKIEFDEIFQDPGFWETIVEKEGLIEKLNIKIHDSKELWDKVFQLVKKDKNRIKMLAVCCWEEMKFSPKNRMILCHSQKDSSLALIRKRVEKFSHVKELRRVQRKGLYGKILFFSTPRQ